MIKKYISLFDKKEDEEQINSMYVLVEANRLSKEALERLSESRWQDSGIDDWSYRLDVEKTGNGTRRHVHIARKKHQHSKPQMSWDDHGQKRHTQKFPTKVPRVARELAAKILNVPEKLLETVSLNGQAMIRE